MLAIHWNHMGPNSWPREEKRLSASILHGNLHCGIMDHLEAGKWTHFLRKTAYFHCMQGRFQG
uniref:Uncharacterized protein n=1 Tax=Arundo donax TaxID=35708 RepID=A0A0A9DFA9_ARUDO